MTSLKQLSDTATGGTWSVVDDPSGMVVIETDAPPAGTKFGSAEVVSSSEWTNMSDEDAEFVVALVNAFRAGKLVEKS